MNEHISGMTNPLINNKLSQNQKHIQIQASEKPLRNEYTNQQENISLQWNTTWGGDYFDKGNDIAIDSKGNIYVTGFIGRINPPYKDIILLKYSTNGELLWNKTWSGPFDDEGFGITIDGYDNIYVTGSSVNAETSGYNTILLKYNSDGKLIWNRTYTGSIDNQGFGITIDTAGNIFVCGYNWPNINTSKIDVLVLKYTSDGNLTASAGSPLPKGRG